MRIWSVWHGILFKERNSAGSRPSDGLCEQKEPLTPERKRGQKRGPTQLNKLHSHHGAHTVPGPPGICHRTGKFPGPRHLRPESPCSTGPGLLHGLSFLYAESRFAPTRTRDGSNAAGARSSARPMHSPARLESVADLAHYAAQPIGRVGIVLCRRCCGGMQASGARGPAAAVVWRL